MYMQPGTSTISFVNDPQLTPMLVKNLLENIPESKYWSSIEMRPTSKPRIIEVGKETEEFDEVWDYFTNNGTMGIFKITKIERIESPSFLASFILKRRDFQTKQLLPVTTRVIFHASEYPAAQQARNNNWEMSSAIRDHVYGFGTCFSPYSSFVSKFGLGPVYGKNHTFLCHVIQNKPENLIAQLADGYETWDSPEGNLTIKFDDNCAYPAYRVTYEEIAVEEYGLMEENAGNVQVEQAPGDLEEIMDNANGDDDFDFFDDNAGDRVLDYDEFDDFGDGNDFYDFYEENFEEENNGYYDGFVNNNNTYEIILFENHLEFFDLGDLSSDNFTQH